MTDADRVAFAEGMFLLGETFNEPISDVKTEAYFEALSDFEIAAVLAAIRGAVKSSKFCPRPVDLREQLEGNASDNADLAWGEVVKQIRRVGWCGVPTFADPKILPALEAVWGTWRNLCETLPGEGAELVGWVKQFKGTYGTVDRREHKHLTLAGAAPNIQAFVQREQKRIQRGETQTP
jgi:hypothetical protein